MGCITPASRSLSRLQAAVARVLDQGKDRQSFLKKSLGTKDLKAANIRAKLVQAGFDRVFGEAEKLLAVRAMLKSLSATEIKRLVVHHSDFDSLAVAG